MIYSKNKAFTLVELIIVITILAILATIAFISFQNYSKDSRNSNRLTTLKSIETSLLAFQTKTGNYPQPDNWVDISASGVVVWYQWNIDQTLSTLLKISKIPIDPLDQNKYSYATNSIKNKFQLSILTELQSSYIHQSYADNSIKIAKNSGNNLGVFYAMSWKSLEQTGTGIDIKNTTIPYTVYFSNKVLTWTGDVLRVLTSSYAPQWNLSFVKSCKEIFDAWLANTTGVYSINPTLASSWTFWAYCDMSTQLWWWTLLATIPWESVKFADRWTTWIWKTPVYDAIPPSSISNIEYLSQAYGNVPTNEILLCYKDTSMCYNFKHNMNIPLYYFYRDNLSYVDYSYNLYNYWDQWNVSKLQNYFTTFGFPANSNSYLCGFLWINARTASSTATTLAIWFWWDGDGPCITGNNVASNMDNTFLWLWFSQRIFASLNYPWRPVVTAWSQSFNIVDSIITPVNTQYGWINAFVSRNWFIMGR